MALPLTSRSAPTPGPPRPVLRVVPGGLSGSRPPGPRRVRQARLLGPVLAIGFAVAGGAVALPGLMDQPPAPRSAIVVTVQSGDTVWSLAERHAPPGRDVQEVVYDIYARNNLTGTTVHPGDILEIP